MQSEKTPGMEEFESGQQEMQEKIARMTKMVTNLTKEKGITNDPDLQRNPTSLEGAQIHPLSQIRTTLVNKED